MNTTQTLNLILAELKSLQGQPLTWGNLQWLDYHIEAIREVATPSELKDSVLRKLGGKSEDCREILIRRSVDEHDALIEKAGNRYFIGVVDEMGNTLGYRIWQR